MCQLVCRVCLVAAILWSVGCGGGGKAKPTPVPVKGTVQLDGTPMADGDITFIVTGEAPTIFDVKAGAYSGNANPGKNRVEIRSYKKAPPNPNALSTDDPNAKVNFIPERFSGLSKLEADVTAGGANDFPFKITSK